jgi:hypothetical protein
VPCVAYDLLVLYTSIYNMSSIFIRFLLLYMYLGCIEMTQKMMFQKKIPIRIDFEDAEAEKFEVVKNYMGLKQNTEVIRALISEKYNELKGMEEKRRLQRIREAEAMEWLEKGEYKCPM